MPSESMQLFNGLLLRHVWPSARLLSLPSRWVESTRLLVVVLDDRPRPSCRQLLRMSSMPTIWRTACAITDTSQTILPVTARRVLPVIKRARRKRRARSRRRVSEGLANIGQLPSQENSVLDLTE